MIYVTGGAGFIGSATVWGLNQSGYEDIVVVDDLDTTDKWKNLRNLRFLDYLDKSSFIQQIRENDLDLYPDTIIHFGACSSTTETDVNYLMNNNYAYTRDLAEWCVKNDVQLIYASSAATYGDGESGYSDQHTNLKNLQPLNPYAFSKHLFDCHALERNWLDQITGLKFFNVYGPNEYHKGEMRSVINKSFPQAKEKGTIRLFKSHREDIDHGQQKRDFMYVKDAVEVTLHFIENPGLAGIYNVGTGNARYFDDLAEAVFNSLEKPTDIEYFDMPEEIRDNYQYFTEASIQKLRNAGFDNEFHSLEDGIDDYVKNYLCGEDPYLGSEPAN